MQYVNVTSSHKKQVQIQREWTI